MPRKRPNLKARLDTLRGTENTDPASTIALTLRLDADLHRMLKQLAQGEEVRLEYYAVAVLNEHVEVALGSDDAREG